MAHADPDHLELFKRVNEAVKSIRPHLVADGGDVVVESISSENDVYINWRGTCQNCSLSKMTLKLGLEQAIKNHVPEIRSVIPTNGLDAKLPVDE